MNSNNNKNRKELNKFLKGSRSKTGEKIFQQWTSSLLQEKNADKLSDETGEKIKVRINQKLDELSAKRSIRTTLTNKMLLRIAASITILLVVSYSFYLLLDFKENTYSIAQMEDVQTVNVPYGEKKTIQLKDGTVVRLNSGSVFSFPKDFLGEKRIVSLEGEAFFNVAKNAQKPFVVESGKITTTVLGTSFNIESYPDENLTVTVATGKVKVSKSMDSNGNTVYLLPGEQALFNKEEEKLITQKVNVGKYTDWQNNILHFEHESFAKVLEQLQRSYNVIFQCYNEDLLQQTIKTSFKDASITTVMDDLQFILKFEYTYDKANRIITIKDMPME